MKEDVMKGDMTVIPWKWFAWLPFLVFQRAAGKQISKLILFNLSDPLARTAFCCLPVSTFIPSLYAYLSSSSLEGLSSS
jgi:hypothetical protein